jgi:hypothetical protein
MKWKDDYELRVRKDLGEGGRQRCVSNRHFLEGYLKEGSL